MRRLNLINELDWDKFLILVQHVKRSRGEKSGDRGEQSMDRLRTIYPPSWVSLK